MAEREGTASGTVSATRVVVVLINWRQVEDTLRCLRDLAECGHDALSVLVIDNGSHDGSAERLRADGGAVQLLLLEHNVGYCRAVNLGIEWAREQQADYVLLLNNDVEMPAGFLPPLVSVLDLDPAVACVGPTMLRPDGKVWAQGGSLAFAPNFNRLRDAGAEPAPVTEGPVAVDYIPGACALYRLADLAAVEDVDADYFMYWEEVDLAERIRTVTGQKVLWLPWVRVVHRAAGSSGGDRAPFRKYASALNSVRWLKTHGRARHWAAFALFDVFLWPVSFLSGTPLRSQWAKLRGIAAGLIGKPLTVADVERYLGAESETGQ